MSTICVLIEQAPGPDPESIELILALATFEHQVRVIFAGSGIGWLYNHQEARKTQGKSPSRVLSALPMYDCEQLFFRAADISTLNIDPSALTTLATPVSDADIQQQIAAADFCLSF